MLKLKAGHEDGVGDCLGFKISVGNGGWAPATGKLLGLDSLFENYELKSEDTLLSLIRLFCHEVASVAKGDEDFKDALKDPLYAGTRKALYSDKIPNGKAVLELPDPKEDICRLYDEKRNGSGALELQDLKEGACVGLDEGTGDDSGALGLNDLKKDSCLQLDERTKDSNDALQLQDPLKDSCVSLDQGTRTNIQDKSPEQKVQADDSLTTSVRHDDFMAGDIKVHSEIEEINETSKMVESLDETDQIVHNSRANQPVHVPAYNKKVGISSEVCQALGTLEKAISIIRDFGYNVEIRSVPGNTTVMPAGVKEDGQKDSKSSESDRIHGSIVTRAESPKKGFLEASPYEHRNSSASQGSRRTSSSLCTREANHKKIAPASPDENVETSGDAQHAAVHTSVDQMKEGYVTAVDANGFHEKAIGKRKRKLPFYCCLYFLPGQVMG